MENSVQTKKDLHSGPFCAAKFGKVAKCAAGAKSLRTTDVQYLHARASDSDVRQVQWKIQTNLRDLPPIEAAKQIHV